jgi:hypothetical protein
MTNSSTQNDTITLEFINPTSEQAVNTISQTFSNSNNTSANNFTQINMEKDFFTPANGITIVLEDDRVFQLTSFLQRGYKVRVSINGNVNMICYIFDYRLRVTRGSGTQLTIQCKDLLEYMAQGTVYPNMGMNTKTNFHFKPTDTFQYALSTIANAFADATNSGLITIMTDNSTSLTLASGGQVGIANKGKTPTTRSTSLSKAINHLSTPQKGESYLAYMLRLTKHIGGNIKMSDTDEDVIMIKPPVYDRATPSPFKLIHYITPPNNLQNNVLESDYHFGLDKQPSVVIAEANTTGDGKFYQSTLKGIAINEMTGYPLLQGATPSPIASVNDAITQLTNGTIGTGYISAPFNDQLYAQRTYLAVDINTQVSMPYYTVDYNAHTADEVSYGASKILSEQQDRYVEFKYRVQGWTMVGTTSVWQPDMMVSITEELFSPGSTTYTNIPMWIKRVNYIKTRNGGTETEITCTLPYTHNFQITP